MTRALAALGPTTPDVSALATPYFRAFCCPPELQLKF
jgi:hypothetical protein